jgi:CheY-like chemotaxis protein
MPTVLIVDDDPDVRMMLAVFLELAGVEVVIAANGREALERLASDRPSVILLDLMMPVMDGIEFRQRQEQHDRFREIPVVCLSAHHNARHIARKLGVAEFLGKPFELDAVMNVVRRYCPA